MTQTLKRKAFFKTDSPPCCLRVNPLDPTFVYFGTYTLIRDRDRSGTIEVWKLSTNSEYDIPDDGVVDADLLTAKAHKVKTINTHGAVLDIKIDTKTSTTSDNFLLLAAAHSTGNISFWKVNKQDPIDVMLTADIQLFDQPNGDNEILITSINFHSTKNYLTFTTTTGIVGYYDYERMLNAESVVLFGSEHSLEAWYGDWGHSPYLENVVFSGGDDAKLIAHDTREQTPIFATDRIHEAGIVSILTSRKNWCENVTDPFTIWTGGYDDNLCVLDLRAGVGTGGSLFNGVPPLIKEKHNLGGGVWRLIPAPGCEDNRVLTCNMYDGGRILEYNPATAQDISTKNYFKGDHSSITYGGDWIHDFAVTCSFYDNVVQIWDIQDK